MLVDLDIPYRDVGARDLSLSLTPHTVPALAAARFHFPTHEVNVAVLGSSHQVHIDGPSPLYETVACLGSGESLPAKYESTGYHFKSLVRRLDGKAFEAIVARLIARAGQDGCVILGRFPGHPLALTMVYLGERGVDWETWHTYPRNGEVVYTRSTVR